MTRSGWQTLPELTAKLMEMIFRKHSEPPCGEVVCCGTPVNPERPLWSRVGILESQVPPSWQDPWRLYFPFVTAVAELQLP